MTKLINVFINNINILTIYLLDVLLVGSIGVTITVMLVMSLVREMVSIEDDRMVIVSRDSVPILRSHHKTE